MTQNRIIWIDLLKGLGIVLLILGHTPNIPESVHSFIYSFHMPLFFLISGFLWNDINLKITISKWVKRKFRSLIFPYFKIAGICFIVWGIVIPLFLSKSVDNYDYLYRLLKYLFGIIYSIGTVEYMPQCSPIWFLTAMFCASLFFFLVHKDISSSLSIFIFLVIGFVGTLILHLPWNMNSAIIGCFFMSVGYEIKKRQWHRNFYMLLISVFILILNIVYMGLPTVNMDENEYSNFMSFIIIATVVNYCLLAIFYWGNQWLNKLRYLNFVSENSIPYFGYDYSANMVYTILSFIGITMWSVVFIMKFAMLTCFIILLNRLKINKIFF